MSLQDEINKRIKEEIEQDPEGVEYAGKTDDEIMLLLNSPQVKTRVVEDTHPSPMSRIMNKLASAPNAVTKEEVTSAKVFVVEGTPKEIL